MKKIIVTGGLGFIGFHLVKYLLKYEKGYIIVIDHTPRELFDNDIQELLQRYKNNITVINADLTKSINFPTADEIYHLAGGVASKGVETKNDLVYNSLISMENLLQIYGDETRFLFTSSTEVAGDITQKLPLTENCQIGWTDISNPRWNYSIAKFTCESLLMNYPHRNNYNIARLSNTYGERMKQNYVIKSFVTRILNNENPLKISQAMDTRSFTYVTDIVEGLVKIMESKYTKEIFNLGTSQSITILELARKLLKISGGQKNILQINDGSSLSEKRLIDISKAKRLLNWSPLISLDNGLEKTFLYYKHLV